MIVFMFDDCLFNIYKHVDKFINFKPKYLYHFGIN